ncbi:hypothetical protein D3C86_1762460 [compost metagenome]
MLLYEVHDFLVIGIIDNNFPRLDVFEHVSVDDGIQRARNVFQISHNHGVVLATEQQG